MFGRLDEAPNPADDLPDDLLVDLPDDPPSLTGRREPYFYFCTPCRDPSIPPCRKQSTTHALQKSQRQLVQTCHHDFAPHPFAL
jgi:hypothetical protein